MKRFLLRLTGGLLVLLLAGLIGLSFYTQTNHFRAWAREQILSTLRPSVNGEIMIGEISGSWWSGITLHKVVVRQNGLEVLSVPEGIVTFDLLPQLLSFLRSSSFRIGSLTLDTPVLRLSQDPQMGWNISQLFKTSEQSQETPSQVSIFFEHIGFTDGQITIQPASAQSTHLTGLSFAGNLALLPTGTQVELGTLSFALARDGLPVVQWDGGAAYDATQSPPVLALHQVHLRTANSHVQLAGTVRDPSSPLLALTAEIERLAVSDVHALMPTLPLQDDLSGVIHADGPLSGLRVETTASTPHGQATVQLTADLAHSPQQYEGTLALKQLVIQKVLPVTNLAGIVTGQARFSIAGDDHRTGTFEGHIAEVFVRDQAIGAVTFGGKLDNRQLAINGTSQGPLSDTRWQGNLTLGTPLTYDLTLTVRNFEVARATQQPLPVPITLNLDAAIAGSGTALGELNSTVKVTLLPSRVGEVTDAQGQFSGSVHSERILIEALSLQAKDTTLSAEGTVVLRPGHSEGSMSVMPAKAGIQEITALACGDASWIPACAGMTPLLSPPQNQTDRVLVLPKETGQSFAQLGGTLTYSLQSTNLTPWLALVGQQGSGGVSLQGNASGSLAAFQLAGDATLTNVRVADSSLQRSTINYTFTNLGSPQAGGQVTALLTHMDAGIPWSTARLNLTLTETQPVTIRTAFTGQDSQQRTQQIQGQLRYTPDRLEVVVQEMNLQLLTGIWRTPQPAQILVHQQTITIDNFHVQRAESSLSAQGTLSFQGAQNLQLQVNRLPLSEIRTLLGTGPEVSGHVSATAQVQGTAAKPELSADITTSPITVTGQTYAGLTAHLTYRQPRLQLNAVFRQDAAHTLTFDGGIPLSLSWVDQSSTAVFGDADFRVRSDGLSLAFLNMFTQGVQNIQGTVLLDVRVQGPLQALAPTGQAQLENGQVRVPQLSITYDEISLALQLTPEALLLSSLRARSGSGLLTGSGRIGLQAYTVTAIDMTLNADEFQVIATRQYAASVSGRLAGTGSLQRPVVRGELQVRNTTLRPDIAILRSGPAPPDPTITVVSSVHTTPLSPPEPAHSSPAEGADRPPLLATNGAVQNPLYERLGLDIEVAIPRNTWVQLDEGTIEFMGQVRARKSANEPLLLIGTIETVRGWYSLHGRKFRVDRGSIRFTGTTPIDPSLDVVAQYTLPDYRVELVMSGTAREPSVSLRSEPALEQADILSLLIFGKPTHALNAGERSSLQSQALQTAAGYIASDLRRALASELGLDNLELDVGQTLDQSRIGAGTYVTENIFVSTSQQLEDKHGREFSLEYHLDENWQIKVTTTTRSNSGADILWQKRY